MTTSTVPLVVGTSAPAPRTTRRRAQVTPWVLLGASLAVFAVMVGYPLVRLVVMSFQEYERAQLMGLPAEWVGLDNYRAVLTDPTFWVVLGRSAALMVVCVVLTMTLGTAMSLLMMRVGKGARLLLSVGMLLAWAMPPLAATTVWGWIFDTEYGVVNNLLTQLTGNRWFGHSWLLDPWGFFTIVTCIIVWGAVPFVAFTMYAGLSAIPGERLEAAAIDGASALQRFRLIMLPAVRSIVTVLVVLSMIWDLKVFAQIFALQDIGGVRERTNTMGVYIYQMGMSQGHYGMASAIAVIFTVIMLAVSAYYVRRTLKDDEA